jgi:hypothetical protein
VTQYRVIVPVTPLYPFSHLRPSWLENEATIQNPIKKPSLVATQRHVLIPCVVVIPFVIHSLRILTGHKIDTQAYEPVILASNIRTLLVAGEVLRHSVSLAKRFVIPQLVDWESS